MILDDINNNILSLENKLSMLNTNYDLLKDKQGYYSTDGYYCVLTKGYNNYSINKTDYHEVCHSLIDNDYYHFCLELYE